MLPASEPDAPQQTQLEGIESSPSTKALVLVDDAPDLELWYLLPLAWDPSQVVGCRVTVPLRRRSVQGTIIQIVASLGDEGYNLREIQSLIHPEPLVPGKLLELAHWISSYYFCRLEVVVRGMIPEMIRSGGGGFRSQKSVELHRFPPDEEFERLEKRAKKQAAVLALLRERGQPMFLSDLNQAIPGAGSVVKRLEEQGWVETSTQIKARNPTGTSTFLPSEPLELNDEQSEVLQIIKEDLHAEEKTPILLKGVTGSGKTEVYLQAIAEVIENGQNVIVLVPEISLTPQTTERFKRRFASIQDQVAILHSHLSEGERHDEWRKILDHRARIVIGARSAIFAPLQSIGLIVVDEEHENSYKQENPPRYQGRDIAVVRCKLEGATLVLGSATPSLESFQNVHQGKYQLAELTKRADGQKPAHGTCAG
ncbi:MAG: primosomal protein N', partial [Verrucomicrobiota bacterium]